MRKLLVNVAVILLLPIFMAVLLWVDYSLNHVLAVHIWPGLTTFVWPSGDRGADGPVSVLLVLATVVLIGGIWEHKHSHEDESEDEE